MGIMFTFFFSCLFSLFSISSVEAGIVQWRNRVPAAEANPNNIGSYVNTIEIGNGGTTGYDSGIDVDLDTSTVPNDEFLVTYVDHAPDKTEYEFSQNLQPGESYTAKMSFENRLGDFYFTPNTIEFLAAEGNYTYDYKGDSNGDLVDDIFRSGDVALGEITPWSQVILPGQDHRNDWFYGELTITNVSADYDNNGTVDGLDFLQWQQTPTIDLSYLETQYGTTSAVAASVVPEPCTAMIALMGLILSNRSRGN